MRYSSRPSASQISGLLLGVGAASILTLGLGFLHPSALAAQSADKQGAIASTDKESVCFAHGRQFLAGSVIWIDSAKHECSAGEWIPTMKPLGAVFRFSQQPRTESSSRAVCQIRPSTSDHSCRCQDGDYSLGAIVESADRTFIRCDRYEIGKFTAWRPATPNEMGQH